MHQFKFTDGIGNSLIIEEAGRDIIRLTYLNTGASKELRIIKNEEKIYKLNDDCIESTFNAYDFIDRLKETDPIPASIYIDCLRLMMKYFNVLPART